MTIAIGVALGQLASYLLSWLVRRYVPRNVTVPDQWCGDPEAHGPHHYGAPPICFGVKPERPGEK